MTAAKSKQLQVRQMEINKLKPYKANARTHSEEQVDQIAASIKAFGFNVPILIDKTNTIIAGHGRLMAARKLGLNKVPTILLSHLNDAQRRAYIIADNKLAENAGWDEELLSSELAALNDLNFDLSLTGFDEESLKELLDDEPTNASSGLAQIETRKPPEMTWTLIGIPTVEYGEIAMEIEAIAQVSSVIMETSSNDKKN